MTKKFDGLITDRYLDCFGDFDIANPICKSHCILCLRCIVEKNQNARMEVFEELMAGEMIPMRMQ